MALPYPEDYDFDKDPPHPLLISKYLWAMGTQLQTYWKKKPNVFSRYNAFLKWYVTEIADVITPLFLFMILIGFRKKSIPYQISDNI